MRDIAVILHTNMLMSILSFLFVAAPIQLSICFIGSASACALIPCSSDDEEEEDESQDKESESSEDDAPPAPKKNVVDPCTEKLNQTLINHIRDIQLYIKDYPDAYKQRIISVLCGNLAKAEKMAFACGNDYSSVIKAMDEAECKPPAAFSMGLKKAAANHLKRVEDYCRCIFSTLVCETIKKVKMGCHDELVAFVSNDSLTSDMNNAMSMALQKIEAVVGQMTGEMNSLAYSMLNKCPADGRDAGIKAIEEANNEIKECLEGAVKAFVETVSGELKEMNEALTTMEESMGKGFDKLMDEKKNELVSAVFPTYQPEDEGGDEEKKDEEGGDEEKKDEEGGDEEKKDEEGGDEEKKDEEGGDEEKKDEEPPAE